MEVTISQGRRKLGNFHRKTSIGQRPTEISPKPTKKLISVCFDLTSVVVYYHT
jgi:hypothetical protein